MDEIRRIREKLVEITQYIKEIEDRIPTSLNHYLESDLTFVSGKPP